MSRSMIVIEGLDGSGKATQTNQLCQTFQKSKMEYRHITFPDYEQESSALIKMYLGGAFGSNPGCVNAYAAASFYAVDRYASYQRFWKKAYLGGTCILADRYATSNFIYQLTKLPKKEWDQFIDWAEDYEYHKLELPKPDIVLYLDMPPEVSQVLMSKRYQGNEEKKDIHERNIAFLNQCRETALYSAAKLGWHVIACAERQIPKSIAAIHHEIMNVIAQNNPNIKDIIV